VRFHRPGIRRFHHPAVGNLTFSCKALVRAADTSCRSPPTPPSPSAPSDDALKLLDSWTATLDQAEAAPAADGG
jgi:hypothetical protein